ncbi:transposase [Pseudomonas marginalis]|uniref:Transposase n=1 Tax=Pseudomonas marginalis TaxID=298 RepID=A0A9X9BMR5_PSEMA|nr:transposase [Pseudomonas marginalis]TWR52337.1 transposase [Pseudomonas marginalis]SEB60177.1 Transposase [Pseudomonas marginalis]
MVLRIFTDAITLNVKMSLRQRNSYPKPFKAQVIQEYPHPGATLSSVAIRHGINTNVIRK